MAVRFRLGGPLASRPVNYISCYGPAYNENAGTTALKTTEVRTEEGVKSWRAADTNFEDSDAAKGLTKIKIPRGEFFVANANEASVYSFSSIDIG
jgi:hypothetical protein